MGLIDLICVMSDCSKGKSEFLELANKLKELESVNTDALKPYLLKENNKIQKPASKKAENQLNADNKEDVILLAETLLEHEQITAEEIDYLLIHRHLKRDEQKINKEVHNIPDAEEPVAGTIQEDYVPVDEEPKGDE